MSEHRRPKVGDRVQFEATVVHDDGEKFIQVAVLGARHPSESEGWFDHTALTILPAAPEPRPDWEVLRHAAGIWDRTRHYATISSMMREEADRLEAAARPKPPALRDAVRTYISVVETGPVASAVAAFAALREALAREDAA